MFRFALICAFLACAAAGAVPIKRVEDLENMKSVKTTNEETETEFLINYSFGEREEGDSLGGIKQEKIENKKPELTMYQIVYVAPPGKVITHINIDVKQTESGGEGFILYGGIGQNSASVIVKAFRTMYLIFSADFYVI